MAYRFQLNGQGVECDSASELFVALGELPPTPPTTEPNPTRKGGRRKRTTGSNGSAKSNGKRKGNPAAAAHSWALAKFYSAKRGVNKTPREARAYLSEHPEKKKEIEREMAAASG